MHSSTARTAALTMGAAASTAHTPRGSVAHDADAGANVLRSILELESEKPLDGSDVVTPRSSHDGSAVQEVIRLRRLLDAHLDRTEQVLRRSAQPTPVARGGGLDRHGSFTSQSPVARLVDTPRSIFRQLSNRLSLAIDTRVTPEPTFTPVVLDDDPLIAAVPAAKRPAPRAATPADLIPTATGEMTFAMPLQVDGTADAAAVEAGAGDAAAVADPPQKQEPASALQQHKQLDGPMVPLPFVTTRFSGHLQTVTCCAFSVDGKFVVSGSADKSLRLFKVASGWCMRVMRGHTDTVTCCAVLRRRAVLSPRSEPALSSRKNSKKNRGSPAKQQLGAKKAAREASKLAMISTRPAAETELMASGGRDNCVMVWNWRSGHQVCSLSGHRDTVSAVDIALVPRDWAQRNSPSKRSSRRRAKALQNSSLSADVAVVLSASEDKTMKLWSVATGQLVRSFKEAGQKRFYACTFGADAKTAYSAGADCEVTEWSVRTAQALRTFTVSDIPSLALGYLYCITVSSNGKYLVGGSSSKSLYRWPLQGPPAAAATAAEERESSGKGGGSTTKKKTKKKTLNRGRPIVPDARINGVSTGWVVSASLTDVSGGDEVCAVDSTGGGQLFSFTTQRLIRRLRLPLNQNTPKSGVTPHTAGNRLQASCFQSDPSKPLQVVCPGGRSLALWKL